MPLSRRRDRDASQDDARPDSEAPQAEWREPPGRLGEFVRRVKRMTAASGGAKS